MWKGLSRGAPIRRAATHRRAYPALDASSLRRGYDETKCRARTAIQCRGQPAGLGNLVTGLLGAGYTGSYIFSQTLFAMRAGVATRLHSWIIAAMELGMFALPFSVQPLLSWTW